MLRVSRHSLIAVAALFCVLAQVSSGADWCTAPAQCTYSCTPPPGAQTDSNCTAYFDLPEAPCGDCPNVCKYNVDRLSATASPTLRLLESGQQASTPYATRFFDDTFCIAWNEPVLFDPAGPTNDDKFTFLSQQAGAQCASLWTEGTPEADVTDKDNCVLKKEICAPWSTLYQLNAQNESLTLNPCGFVRVDSNPDNVILTLDFRVNYLQATSPSDRSGSQITRSVDFRLPVELRFPKQVNITVSYRAFSSIEYGAAITRQAMSFPGGDPTQLDDVRVDLRVLTIVQQPFDTFLAPGDGITSVPQQRIVIDQQATRALTGAFTSDCTDGSDCAYEWDMVFGFDTGNTGCNFNGDYTFELTTTCAPPDPTSPDAGGPYINTTTGLPTSACPVDNTTQDATIILTVTTSNLCPDVVANIQVSATSQTFEFECPDTDCTYRKSSFLHAQVVHLTAAVWSNEASIARTYWRRCIMSAGDPATPELAKVLLVYDSNFVDGQGYYNFKRREGGFALFGTESYPAFNFTLDTVDDFVGDGRGTSFRTSSGTVINLPDPVVANGPRVNIFQVAEDSRVPVQMTCTIQVVFDNTAVNDLASEVSWDLTDAVHNRRKLLQAGGNAEIPEDSVQVDRFIFAGEDVVPTSESGVPTSTIVYGAVGAVAGAAVIGLIVVLAAGRRGSQKKQDGQRRTAPGSAKAAAKSSETDAVAVTVDPSNSRSNLLSTSSSSSGSLAQAKQQGGARRKKKAASNTNKTKTPSRKGLLESDSGSASNTPESSVSIQTGNLTLIV